MTVVTEIETQIAATQAEVEAVLSRLNEMGDVEAALKSANDKIGEAATNVAEVAQAIRMATEELRGATNALRQVADVVRQTEPGRIIQVLQESHNGLKRVEEASSHAVDSGNRVLERLDSMQSDLAKQTSVSIDELSQKTDEQRSQIISGMSDLHGSVKGLGSEQKDALSCVTEEVRKLRTIVFFAVAFAGLTLAVQAYTILGH